MSKTNHKNVDCSSFSNSNIAIKVQIAYQHFQINFGTEYGLSLCIQPPVSINWLTEALRPYGSVCYYSSVTILQKKTSSQLTLIFFK